MSFDSVFEKFPIMETEKLLLRDMRPEDSEDLFNYFSNREVSKYLNTYGPKSIEGASNVMQSSFFEKDIKINRLFVGL